ncbi:hypothetical protein Ciccas_000550 [Cichlidogyrus casuarinus]|uniref:Ig-like domain-containing protein n=1 Tax=Cichlidogyrus casuarinus TaxID=1844966 RepID=A0ABD2QMJ8_9PLAT
MSDSKKTTGLEVIEGQNLSMACKSDDPTTIEWYHDQIAIKISPRVEIHQTATSSKLRLKNVTFDDSGQYFCRATKSNETESGTVNDDCGLLMPEFSGHNF